LGQPYAPFLGSYQLQVECFRGGVGSCLLGSERAKFVWDLRNIFQLNFGSVTGNPVKGRPLTKVVGSNESAIRDPYDYSIGFGTMFINGLNHTRSQQIGVFSIGVLEVAGNYVNDGPFLHYIGLGDGYDRWWTGAGFAGVYFQNNAGFVTEISLQYQRFTGWQPNLYEMTNLLGIDYLSYLNLREEFFNQGCWSISFGVQNAYHLDFKLYEARRLDIQNMIHIKNSYTFHPNVLKRRSTFGARMILNSSSPIN
jgi:hypothetical protein